MRLTLNIPEDNSTKAIALIEYLKSLDYVILEQEDEILVPEWHKEIVRKRVQQSKPNQLLEWDKVKENFKVD